MRVSKLPFKVIDVRTGREYSEKAVTKDGYTDGLMEMDLDGFMICEDGYLAFGDECGRYNCVNTTGKYEIEIEGYVAIDEVLSVLENLEQSNYTTPLFGNDGKCAGFLINTWVLRDEIMALKADTINGLEGKE